MPGSKLKKDLNRDGSGITDIEEQLISFTINDELYLPRSLSATISNQNDGYNQTNTGASPKYIVGDEVAIVDTDTSKTLFRGKIESIRNPTVPRFGQTIEFIARDNLAELGRRNFTKDYSSGALGGRHLVIKDIIDDHIFASASIVTGDALSVASANTTSLTYPGNSSHNKRPLQAIQDLARQDPWESGTSPSNVGAAFYLDEDLKFNYFKMASKPDLAGATSNGLTIQHGGTPGNLVKQMVTSSFDEAGFELVSECTVNYQDSADSDQLKKIRLKAINMENRDVGSVQYTVGEVVQEETTGNQARVQYSVIHASNDGVIIVSPTTEDDAAIPTFTNGKYLNGNTSSVRADIKTTVENNLQMTVEKHIAGHELVTKAEAVDAAKALLLRGSTGDTTGAKKQKKGFVSIVEYPMYYVGGAWKVVRVGEAIRIVNTVTATDSGTIFAVTKIVHSQGPGALTSTIEFADVGIGPGPKQSYSERVFRQASTGSAETLAQIGSIPLKLQSANLGNLKFTSASRTSVTWIASGANGVKFTDGTAQTINSGSVTVDAAQTHLYIIKGNAVLQTATDIADTQGKDKLLIAHATQGAIAEEVAKIHVVVGAGSDALASGTYLTNTLSALSANLGRIDAGIIRIEKDTGVTASDKAGFNGFLMDGTEIGGYASGVLQAGIKASDGTLTAGAGDVIINASGITLKGGDDSAAGSRIRFEGAATGVAHGVLYANDAGSSLGDMNIIMYPIAGSTPSNLVVGKSGSTGGIIPGNDDTMDLGSASKAWDHVWANDLLLAAAATASGAVQTSSYGMFRYAVDGGYWSDADTGGADTLAFLNGQASSAPARDTVSSSFWTMLSESDGSTGSRLIFEPIVPYGDSDATKNRSYVGWNNRIFGGYFYSSNAYYMNSGNGSASFPSFTFTGDYDTGMYRASANTIGFAAGGASKIIMTSSGHWYPYVDDAQDLGLTDQRWDDVYATNGTIQTSDLRMKENIQPTKLGLDFINDLNPITYKWKKKKEDKIDATHYGIIAQEVIETLKDYGITSLEDFAGIHNDGHGEAYYGARYTEFIPILMKAIQELSAEVKELKEKK